MIASNPAGEAPVLPALAYELPAPSTSIVDRKQCVRAYPSSASSLSLTGTKTVRIRLGGEGFIDPSSIRLQYTIENKESKWMRPFTGPWGVWGQVYCRSNGVELDNIPYYGRHHQMFGWNFLTRAEQYGSVGVEGMHMSNTNADNYKPSVGEINGGASLTCMHRLHLSLLSSGKLIPVKYAPLEIELSLLSNVKDWLNDANTGSQQFELQNIQILADEYQLDEAVLSSFYSALLKNRVLSIPVMSAYQVVHPIPSGATTYSFSSVRAFSRLAQIWLTFRKDGPLNSSFICPGALPGDAVDDQLTELKNTAVPTARLSIGPHNWPDPQPVGTAAEYYYMLTKALGHQPNVTRYDFEHNSFTICFDIKRNPQDATSSISTRSGDLVRVELTNLTANAATECWMTLVSFGVVAIRESGVTLLT
jgi:hypothetical protein